MGEESSSLSIRLIPEREARVRGYLRTEQVGHTAVWFSNGGNKENDDKWVGENERVPHFKVRGSAEPSEISKKSKEANERACKEKTIDHFTSALIGMQFFDDDEHRSSWTQAIKDWKTNALCGLLLVNVPNLDTLSLEVGYSGEEEHVWFEKPSLSPSFMIKAPPQTVCLAT